MKAYQVLQFVDGYGNDIRYFEDGVFLKEEDAIAYCKEQIKIQYGYQLENYEEELKEDEEAALEGRTICRMMPTKKPNLDEMLEDNYLGKVELSNQGYEHMSLFYIEIDIR